MSAASAVHGRSPRPLEHFESDSAVVKQDVLELEEKTSAEPMGKKDPSSGEAGRSAEADPKLSIADLIEAINQLEEKRGAAEATQQVKKAAPVQHTVKAAPG